MDQTDLLQKRYSLICKRFTVSNRETNPLASKSILFEFVIENSKPLPMSFHTTKDVLL